MKLGQGMNIAQNHSSNPWEVISGHYWPQFTCTVDQLTKSEIRPSYYLLQFGFIYPYLVPTYHFRPYLALVTYIWPYLVIFAHNCPDLTICAIFTYIGILLFRLHLCVHFRAIGQLLMEILHFKELDTESVVTNAVLVLI